MLNASVEYADLAGMANADPARPLDRNMLGFRKFKIVRMISRPL